MPSERNQLPRSSHRDVKSAFAGFMICVACSVALILISFWGMITLELSEGQFVLGSLLTFTLAALLAGGGAMAYQMVKSRPEAVKVLASRTPSQNYIDEQ